MPLRVRLSLLYTVLVALILVSSGVALHVLLYRSLLSGVDESLEEAAKLVAAVTDTVGGVPRLSNADELSAEFSNDLVARLYAPNGTLVAELGRVPSDVPVRAPGYTLWEGWRTLTVPLEGGTITVLRQMEDTQEALRRFDALFLLLAPVAVLAAFVLGYVLAGRALVPVDRLTRSAHDLARRRAWRERLPEPERRDELWRLARATNILLGALGSVIESERHFTADAAHELRTPLTVLQGRLEKGREQAADPAGRARRSMRPSRRTRGCSRSSSGCWPSPGPNRGEGSAWSASHSTRSHSTSPRNSARPSTRSVSTSGSTCRRTPYT